MAWPFSTRSAEAAELLADRVGMRVGKSGSAPVSRDQALRDSAMWAGLRLRADLLSTMPVDVFRRINGVQVEQRKPPIFTNPGGDLGFDEFLYATQFDLDSTGNTVGVITAIDGLGLPAEIELADIDEVTFLGKGNRITKVRIGRDEYAYKEIWHERQFVKAGVPVGLSPITYAAMSLRQGLTAREFAHAWYANSTMPGGHLKNTAKKLNKAESRSTKASFKESIDTGDVWVSGSDWEYKPLAAKASDAQFLETQNSTHLDVCRYIGVPGDMIDVAADGQHITYANITQRNLQLLIVNLGPAIIRRESRFNRRLLRPSQYVKFNESGLLRMDYKTRLEGHSIAIEHRIYPPSRALDMENMPPLTPEEVAEFAELFPVKPAAKQGATP